MASDTVPVPPGSRSRAWCFTYNNYDDEVIRRLDALTCERIIVGKEVAPTTGTPHLQGYVRFAQPARFSWWKNNFPKASVRIAKGTDAQNEVYCSKESVVINRGVNYAENLVSSRGKRTRDEEAAEVISEIESGAKYGQIRSRHKLFCFWNRRVVLDYMRDEKWLADYPNDDPVA